MEENKIDNPPAFPVVFDSQIHAKGGITQEELLALTTGMSLRDYFAAKALQGLCSVSDTEGTWTHGGHMGTAEEAYKLADAMLKARQTTNKE